MESINFKQHITLFENIIYLSMLLIYSIAKKVDLKNASTAYSSNNHNCCHYLVIFIKNIKNEYISQPYLMLVKSL